jgi:hypothetical protein
MLKQAQMTVFIDRVATKTPPGMRQSITQNEKDEEGMETPFKLHCGLELNIM